MKKVSIITRAFNRLEYTIKCIDNIIRTTKYDEYDHVIINNNSTDGTKEWLNWIKEFGDKDYYKNVKPIHMDDNYGDWGGMLKSVEFIDEKSEYIIQLDNDIIVDDPLWLDKMITVLENGNSIVQLKRIGVGTVINIANKRNMKYNNEVLCYGNITRPVACFMLRLNDFKRLLPQLQNTQLFDINGKLSGKTQLSKLLGNKTVKIENLKCYMIDGITDGYLNYKKYPNNVVHIGK